MGTKHRGHTFGGPVALFVFCILMLTGITACSPEQQAAIPENDPTESLIGSWIRPAGGYVLQILSAEADGKLKAATSIRAR